jgi:hypothetical protein
VHLGIIPVSLTGPKGVIRTCALLDNGSTTSFIDEDIATRLGLQGEDISYQVSTITQRQKSYSGRSVEVKVTTQACPEGALLKGVWTAPNLSLSRESAATEADVSKYQHLRDIRLEELPDDRVRLLIGVGSGVLTPLEVRPPPSQERPYAERTVLGWIVRGPCGSQNCSGAAAHFTDSHSQPVDPLQSSLERMWATEYAEMSHPDDVSMSREDKKALQLMEESMCHKDGHYEIGLPWKKDATLPNNRDNAAVRLAQVKRRLMKSPELMKMYAIQMEDYITNGYARKVAPDEAATPGHVWYLPHHPVFNEAKPGKVRVVFDGAAQYNGQSINDSLYQGPDLVNNLAGILMRFRKHEVAVTADIQAMFHQVLVPAQDQSALRFLWWENGDLNRPPIDYCMTRHVFGLRSSPSCAALALRQTAADNRASFPGNAADAVERNIYVDDLLLSTSSSGSAVKTAHDVKKMLERGGFRLTKFASNCKNVIKSLPSELWAPQLSEVDLAVDALPNTRTLGMRWETDEDVFQFVIRLQAETGPCTKRKILSAVATIYDPLGLVAPVLLEPKGILQHLTRLKTSWDEVVPDEVLKQWSTWCERLPALEQYAIKRVYGSGPGQVKRPHVTSMCSVTHRRLDTEHASISALKAPTESKSPLSLGEAVSRRSSHRRFHAWN